MDDFCEQSPFMQFAHTLLTNGTVDDAVYHLQHRGGFNINIILYLLWLAKMRYGRLTKRQIRLLESHILEWHQRVISELKYTHALIAISLDPNMLEIKQSLEEEITKAYVLEQQMLHDTQIKTTLLRRTTAQQLTDACVSFMRYCELKHEVVVEKDQTAFAELMRCVFTHTTKSDIKKNILKSFAQFKMSAPLGWEVF